jgi:hypothetical protein
MLHLIRKDTAKTVFSVLNFQNDLANENTKNPPSSLV